MASESFGAEAPQYELVPIREISRITGVNTVTLRAWERRYGLLVPQRTAKGHRLYTRGDIQRVQDIQVWLARGVAIGKVKALLTEKKTGEFVGEINSVWSDIAEKIHDGINTFNRARLEHLLADTFVLYPVEMVADYLLIPLVANMQSKLFGQSARRAFFINVLQEFLHAGIYRQRQTAQGAKIMLVSVPDNLPDTNSIESLLLNYSLLVHQYQAEYLGHPDLKEALLCAEIWDTKIVVMLGYNSLNTSEFQQSLKAWREKSNIPVVLAGNLALLYPALDLDGYEAIYPCAAMQQVHSAINQVIKKLSLL